MNGINVESPQLIRNGSHVMWAVGSRMVARVGEPGTAAVAKREVSLSEWLNNSGVRAVRALSSMLQPTVIDSHPVTWWELLPEHRRATPSELGEVLRTFHGVSVPSDPSLPRFAPLAEVRDRLTRLPKINQIDVAWLLARMSELSHQYADAVTHLPLGLLHGDAWQGNVAILQDGVPVVLDLEAVCVGPQYWDLVATAVDFTDFGRISQKDYDGFVSAYGFDVTHVKEYRLLAEIQELRWASYVVGKAVHDPGAAREAAWRMSCLKGDVPQPWQWTAF